MCVICDKLFKCGFKPISETELKLSDDISLCLDHFAMVASGLEYTFDCSEEELKNQNFTQEDIYILKYINQYGYSNYALLLREVTGSKNGYAKLLQYIKKHITLKDDKSTQDILKSPRKIKAYLDQYVIGQDDAKKQLSIAVHDHWCRSLQGVKNNSNKKSNVLIIGPSGTGKTYLIETLSNLLGVPFVSVNAPNLTASGYVGDSVTDCLKTLYNRAGGDLNKAEHGIIYLDEIDKLAGSNLSQRDVGGMDVQRELLCIVQGSKVPITIEQKNSGFPTPAKTVEIDTSNILFICSGAFIEMKKRLKLEKKNTVGFCSKKDENEKVLHTSDVLNLPTVSDFIDYGMDPQFMGRFPVITGVKELTEGDLVRIISEPTNSILSEYEEKFKLDNVTLRVTRPAIRAIASQANAEGTGARGLRRIFEYILTPYRFNIEDYQTLNNGILTIGKKDVEGAFKQNQSK